MQFHHEVKVLFVLVKVFKLYNVFVREIFDNVDFDWNESNVGVVLPSVRWYLFAVNKLYRHFLSVSNSPRCDDESETARAEFRADIVFREEIWM